MSDPAASVKSIISGRVIDSDDAINNDDPLTRFDHRYTTKINSSDSINSDGNDHDRESGNDLEYSSQSDTPVKNNLFIPSPNLSRNSTTSCLSTTATKDGIEGRKIHRTGPNPYSNQLIANMIRNQDLQSDNYNESESSGPPSGHPPVHPSEIEPDIENLNFKTPTDTPNSPSMIRSASNSINNSPRAGTPASEKYNVSLTSLQTTDAQIDGERGQHVNILGDQTSLSLNAKMSLLNKE